MLHVEGAKLHRGDFFPEVVGIGVDFFRKTCFYGEGLYAFVGGV
jgi:hypothetical protein